MGEGRRERETEREMQVERDEKSSARKGSRAFTQGWVQLQTQHSHPPFYGVVKCPSLLAFALCPFSFLFVLLSAAAVHPSSSLPSRAPGGWSTCCVYVAPCVISFRCVAHARKACVPRSMSSMLFSLPLFLPPFFFSCDDEKILFLFFFSKSPYNLSRAIFSFAFYPCQSFLPIHRTKLYKLLLRKIRGAWNKNSFRDGGRMLNGLFRLFLFRVLKNELDRMISLA